MNYFDGLLFILLPIAIGATSYSNNNYYQAIPPEGHPDHCCEQNFKCPETSNEDNSKIAAKDKTYALPEYEPWNSQHCKVFKTSCHFEKFNCYQTAKCEPVYQKTRYCDSNPTCPKYEDWLCVHYDKKGWFAEYQNECYLAKALMNMEKDWYIKKTRGRCNQYNNQYNQHNPSNQYNQHNPSNQYNQPNPPNQYNNQYKY